MKGYEVSGVVFLPMGKAASVADCDFGEGGAGRPHDCRRVAGATVGVHDTSCETTASCSKSGVSGPAARAAIPYSYPFSKAFRFKSRKLAGTESATALRTASGS